jgi:hypothetical protein
MNIKRVTDEAIIFDNNSKITFDHEQDCCEWNYADFSVLTPNTINYDYDFDENKIEFRYVDELGFVFGEEHHWIFIPCYSEQNGYYTTYIQIFFNDKQVLGFNAREIIH